MAHPDLQADARKPWNQVVQEYDIRECVRCTSMIANDRAYGRPPHRQDFALCECCPPCDVCIQPRYCTCNIKEA